MKYLLLLLIVLPLKAQTVVSSSITVQVTLTMSQVGTGTVTVYRVPGACSATPQGGTRLTTNAPANGTWTDRSLPGKLNQTFCYYATPTGQQAPVVTYTANIPALCGTL